MFFSDLHVQLLSRGILNPGEQLLGQTVTSYVPWWAFGLVQRQYLVLATDQRLVLVDHRLNIFRAAQQLHAIDSIPWASVEEAKVAGLLKKKLRVKGQGERGRVSLSMAIPNAFFGLLAPMKNNMVGARSIASAFASMRGAPQLAPVSHGYGAPISQGYGQPQIGYAQPPQLAAPASQPQAYIPPQNAPGYASVPPPAPSPYGAAPAQPQHVASPFGVPSTNGYPPSYS